MKVEVKQKFRDIHTGDIHFAGDVLDITEERYAEICGVNMYLVEKIPEEACQNLTPEEIGDLEQNQGEEKPEDECQNLTQEEIGDLEQNQGEEKPEDECQNLTPEETENPEQNQEEEKPEKNTSMTRKELEKMKVDELRAKAEEMGIDTIGKKEELIKRMLGEDK